MDFGFRQVLTQNLSQRLTLDQTQSLDMKIAMRLRIIESMRGEDLNVVLDCGAGCGNTLTPAEVVKGFVRDPEDTTTKCPKCKKRFQPKLKFAIGRDASGEIIFMCAGQSLHQLDAKGHAYSIMLPDEIRKANPAMYYSLVFHYGSLRNAFSQIGFDYSAAEAKDWEMKIRPFLGEASDKLIADAAGVHVEQIRALRKSLNIPAWKPKLTEDDEEG